MKHPNVPVSVHHKFWKKFGRNKVDAYLGSKRNDTATALNSAFFSEYKLYNEIVPCLADISNPGFLCLLADDKTILMISKSLEKYKIRMKSCLRLEFLVAKTLESGFKKEIDRSFATIS